MGRSYWFECSKCGYRAVVAGRADCGLNACVQTIVCQDCRALYDAVVRLRIPDLPAADPARDASRRPARLLTDARPGNAVPTFQSVIGRLLYTGARRFTWSHFALQCPVASVHRVQAWNEPGKCPRCGLLLERNALPYRIWD